MKHAIIAAWPVIVMGAMIIVYLMADAICFHRAVMLVLTGRLSFHEWFSNKNRLIPGSGFYLWKKYKHLK